MCGVRHANLGVIYFMFYLSWFLISSYLGGAPVEGEPQNFLVCVLSSITKKGEIERTSLSFGDLDRKSVV